MTDRKRDGSAGEFTRREVLKSLALTAAAQVTACGTRIASPKSPSALACPIRLWALRPDDLLAIGIELRGFVMDRRDRLQAEGAAQISLILPGQHQLEEALKLEAARPKRFEDWRRRGDAPLRRYLAPKSRLCFVISGERAPLPLELDAILDACAAGEFDPQQSTIHFPTGILLEPERGAWSLRTTHFLPSDRRAIWSAGPQPSGRGIRDVRLASVRDPLLRQESSRGYPLDRDLRGDVCGAFANLSDADRPREVSALRFSSLGAFARIDARFPRNRLPPGDTQPGAQGSDVEQWLHVTSAGRDQEVQVVRRGYLLPWRHRAEFVVRTERVLRRDHHGRQYAYLEKREFVRVTEPSAHYGRLHPPYRRACGFTSCTIAESATVSPPLDAGDWYREAEKDFRWIRVGGRHVRFAATAVDAEGKPKPVMLAGMWVSERATPQQIDDLIAELVATDPAFWTVEFHGQDVALVEPMTPQDAGEQVSNGRLSTFTVVFGANGTPMPTGQARFMPRVELAHVKLAAMQAVAGGLEALRPVTSVTKDAVDRLLSAGTALDDLLAEAHAQAQATVAKDVVEVQREIKTCVAVLKGRVSDVGATTIGGLEAKRREVEALWATKTKELKGLLAGWADTYHPSFVTALATAVDRIESLGRDLAGALDRIASTHRRFETEAESGLAAASALHIALNDAIARALEVSANEVADELAGSVSDVRTRLDQADRLAAGLEAALRAATELKTLADEVAARTLEESEAAFRELVSKGTQVLEGARSSLGAVRSTLEDECASALLAARDTAEKLVLPPSAVQKLDAELAKCGPLIELIDDVRREAKRLELRARALAFEPEATAAIRLASSYIDGLDDDLWAVLVEAATIRFAPGRSGGLVSPDISILGLSRKLGPLSHVNGAIASNRERAFAEVKGLREQLRRAPTEALRQQLAHAEKRLGDLASRAEQTLAKALRSFEPKDYFHDAKILGVVPLCEIVGAVLGSQGSHPKFSTVELPEEIRLKYHWSTTRLKPFGPFRPLENPTLEIDIITSIPLQELQPRTTSKVQLEDFAVDLLGLVSVEFDSIKGEFGSPGSPNVDVALRRVEFRGPLAFFGELAKMLSGVLGRGPFIELKPPVLSVGTDVSLPDIGVGVLSISGVRLRTALELHLAGEPPSLEVAFGTRAAPFTVSVALMAGGGFLAMRLDPAGLQKLETAVEFGARIDVNLGVAKGGVYAMGGIYMSLSRRRAELTAYFRLGGYVDVLGIISVSITLYVGLTYVNEGGYSRLQGTATLTLNVKIAFFSFDVHVSASYTFAGSRAEPRRAARGQGGVAALEPQPGASGVMLERADLEPEDQDLSPEDFRQYRVAYV